MTRIRPIEFGPRTQKSIQTSWFVHSTQVDLALNFQMKKYLRKKMNASGAGGKDEVVTVNIQPEDDTDYEAQWSRRMRAARVSGENKTPNSVGLKLR